MFDRFDDRTLEIATVIVVVIIALVILCYLAIYINPYVFFNPFKPPPPVAEVPGTPTPIAATWTPTNTPTSTFTPTATQTWTPSPEPTSTPTDTATPIPTATPTNTPLPPTATLRPTRRPPTRTPVPPTPMPYYFEYAGGRPNCDRTWVWGYVVDSAGLAEANAQMRVGNNEGWRADTWSNEDGYYAFEFAGEAKAGMWFVRVFKGGVARSEQFWWRTNAGCDGPYSLQEVRIDWKRR